ncbi:alpha/beta hydrolase [Agromyces atrinae]|uniref:alpha/beta hydrolase n=1 Tax=Agromyces atrinae TaxID=592376 RepID=UPI001F5A1F6C|nr:alpha/beta hydrolase [Agromyces atrinae]MCI2956992.1 alpha/beta hydrolase [Agromyces atrinae]
MNIESVLPELHAPMKRADVSLPLWLVRVALRVMPTPRDPEVRVRTVHRGNLRLRIYLPRRRGTGPGLLWVHGGGLLFGDAKQDESLCLSTARRLGVVIVSANYRLAPQHPFPAAHDDIAAAWRWFLDHTDELHVDAARIAIGGESAGGGLAAGLVQRITRDGGPQPIAQWLFAPMLDDRTAADRSLDELDHFVWNNTKNRDGWAAYLGTEPGAPTLPPFASAARATDLSGQPPTFLTWTDTELFAAENRAYADHLETSGVPVTVDVVEGGAHGFENWAKDTPVARALIERAQDWLRAALR